MLCKRLLLGSTAGSGKSLFYQVTGVLIGGITLMIVLLLALGSNQVHKCNSRFSTGIHLDEVSKSSKEKISALKILDNFSSRRKHKLFFSFIPTNFR